MTFAPGDVVDGKLRVVRQLGAGGMGAVYEVEHAVTKHRRALKVLHPDQAARAPVVERFLREASAAGRIGDPHIVETHDAGRLSTGEPYLVMDLLDGESLADELERGPLPLPRLRDLLVQTCGAIQAAHDAGIVHRDLKPDNLFVSSRGGAPWVTVLDFGISKFDPALTGAAALTQDGAALGTPYYMSPEQVAGREADSRSDVYALGVIAYEASTGKRPFEADTLPHLAVLIHEGKPAPPSSLRPAIPAALEEIVRRAMATSPAERYACPRDLGSALAALELEPSHLDRSFALDATAATDAPPPPAAPPREPPAASATVPGASLAESQAPMSRTHADAPRAPRRTGLWVALAAACAALIGWRVASPRAPAPGTAPEPSAPARTAIAPEVTPASVPSASAAPPEASASAAPRLTALPAQVREVVAPRAAASARTAEQPAGLARDNPYR
ncbi:MAG: protein kinase [Polyangiaceae bacterium]|nr:protein kinase [Polyangiaceae bacterium]